MATTVKVLAKELKRTAPDLLEQLKAAGIEKSSEDDSITEKDKPSCSSTCKKRMVALTRARAKRLL